MLFLVLTLLEPTQVEAASLTVYGGSRKDYTATAAGETISVSLSGAYTSVSLMGKPSWITQSGSGSSRKITVQKNTSTSSRTGDIVYRDGSKVYTLRITQKGAAPQTVSVRFNNNGGYGNVPNKTYTVGKTYGSLPTGSTPPNGGTKFDGWYTKPSGGTKITPGSTVSASYTTLYAHYVPKTFTITFKDGSTTVSTKTVTYGSTYGSLPTRTKTGHNNADWYTATSGGSIITSGTKVNITANQTLYARYTPKQFTITFKDGSTTVTTRKVTYGSTYGTLPTHTKAGYNAADWYTATSGGTKITSSTKVAITANQTLYARWNSPKTFTITFKDGSTTVSTKSVTYGSTYGTLPTRTKTGHTNADWYTATSGGSKITSSTKVTITANQTLYARYTPKQFTITFKDGSTTVTTRKVTYGSTYGTLPTHTKAGYNAADWYTASSGGTKITSSTKVTITANQTLYARWNSPKTFKISFNGNGGPNVPPQTATYGKTYGSLPILVRSSYEFQGWYTALSGGTKVTSSTKVTITADQTLYAHWKKKNVYTVSVTADGTTKTYSVQEGYGFTFPSAPTTAPDGKRFYGWSLYRDGVLESGYYLPGGTVAIHSDCTVYPKYETIYEKLGTVDGWEIWIIQPDAEEQFDQKHSGQLIKIIDGKDFHGMPDYCIRNSWMFTDHSFKTAVCKLIVNYNERMGRTIFWDRSVIGCVDEWAEHNLIYAVTMGGANYIDFLGDMNHSARDVDLDASGDGYIPAQILNLIKALLP